MHFCSLHHLPPLSFSKNVFCYSFSSFSPCYIWCLLVGLTARYVMRTFRINLLKPSGNFTYD
jgi:hypothetical protein